MGCWILELLVMPRVLVNDVDEDFRINLRAGHQAGATMGTRPTVRTQHFFGLLSAANSELPSEPDLPSPSRRCSQAATTQDLGTD